VLKQEWGNPFTITGLIELWNIAGWPQMLVNSILKFCLYLSKERKLCHGARDISPDLLSTCLFVMELRFDVVFYLG